MKIGFSLSLCIRDIVTGKVDIKDVHHIVTGCAPTDAHDVCRLLDEYSQTYWSKDVARARIIFDRLDREHKISWLARWRKSACNIGWGHWLDLPKPEGESSTERWQKGVNEFLDGAKGLPLP
jgi:hypothetical protein